MQRSDMRETAFSTVNLSGASQRRVSKLMLPIWKTEGQAQQANKHGGG